MARAFAVGTLAALVLASCGTGESRPESERPILVGSTASFTGKLSVESIRQTNGVDLWVARTNAAGGIRLKDGTVRKVAAKFYDDESNPERVQELYVRLLSEDRADFLLSPYSSGLTSAASVIAEQYGAVMISAGAASDSNYRQGFSHVFQVYTPASRYLSGAVDLFASMAPDAKRIAIVYENDKFSTDVAKAVAPVARARGFSVVLEEGYDSSTTDFAPFLNKLRAAAPDAVVGGGHFQDGSTFARQLHEKRLPVRFLSLLVAPAEPGFSELGDAAFGVVGPSQWEPEVAFTPDGAKALGVPWYGPTGPEFLAAYRAAHGEDASYHAAGGYEAALLLEEAIERAGTTDGEAVRAALEKTDLLTFFGRAKFDTSEGRHGLQTGHEMVFVQWQRDEAGRLVKRIVAPKAAKTAEAVLMGADATPGGAPSPPAPQDGVATPPPAATARPAGGGSSVLPSLVDGLLIGVVYGLAAMGLTLIFGVMRVVNLSHGSMIALGMFGTYLLWKHLGVNPFLGVVLVAGIGFAAGLLVYAGAVHRVRDAPHLSSLLATFAVNMVLVGVGTSVFSTNFRNIDYGLGRVSVGAVSVTGTRLAACGGALLATGLLYAFLQRTRPGREIRAVANNRTAAELVGIRSTRVLAVAFGLGTCLAATAGGFIATLFPFTVLSGGSYELKSFVIVVLGGLGSPLGALVGGVVLGLVEGFVPLFAGAGWVPVIEFLLFVAVLLVRPQGLLGARR